MLACRAARGYEFAVTTDRLLAELVAIDSVNPALVPGGAGEGEIAAFVAGWLRDAGPRGRACDEPPPGRPSVIGVAPRHRRRPRR